MDGPGGMPAVENAAWLLDLDGTLIDIAATPDAVVVPQDLPGVLRRLRDASGGALAIVTGRPVAQVDRLLGDTPYAVAGEHGACIRFRPGGPVVREELPQAPAMWVELGQQLVAAHPGSSFEPKGHGFVLHYRGSPEAGPSIREALAALLHGRADFRLLAAKMAWEIRPAGSDKGRAVQALMRHAPFAGRVPVFIGDDVTDEDGMRAATALGGIGLRLPEDFTAPADVRRWLALQAG